MRPDDEQRSRLLRLRSIDAEFAHAVVERSAVEAQAHGCSGGTTNHPTSLTQDFHDVLALDCLEFCWTLKLINRTAISRLLQLREGNLEHRAARKNHCSLDEILKLANVTGPAVGGQLRHWFGRNCLDGFLHLLRKLLCEEVDQQRNIFRSFPQGRQRDRKDV